MSDPTLKRTVLIVGAVLLTLISAVVLLGRASPPSRSSPTPESPVSLPASPAMITWTPSSTEAIVSPGETKTVSVSFVSSKNVRRASVQVSPELAALIHTDSVSFERIRKGEQKMLTLIVAPSASSTLGTITGSIQLLGGKVDAGDTEADDEDRRDAGKLLLQTLRVTVNVWRSFGSDQFGVNVKVPPILQIDATQPNGSLGHSQGETLATFRSVAVGLPGTDAPIQGCFIYLSAEDNSDGLSLADWLVQRSYRRLKDVDTELTVNGTSGILRTGSGDVFGNPFAIFFVSHGTVVFGLGFNTYGDGECNQEFDQILSTLHFGG